MNVVFSVRVFIASAITISLIVVPRILLYFGLESSALDEITSAWATFIILLIAVLIFLWGLIKNIKIGFIIIILAVLFAFCITFYFCELPLPW